MSESLIFMDGFVALQPASIIILVMARMKRTIMFKKLTAFTMGQTHTKDSTYYCIDGSCSKQKSSNRYTKKKKKRDHKPSKIGTNKFRYLLQNSFSQNQFFFNFFFPKSTKGFHPDHPHFQVENKAKCSIRWHLPNTYRYAVRRNAVENSKLSFTN
jgi:hypothetical protein